MSLFRSLQDLRLLSEAEGTCAGDTDATTVPVRWTKRPNSASQGNPETITQ